MTLRVDSGLWCTGSLSVQPPLVAVLEVSGAVLSWTVDADPAEPPVIAFTDPLRADWLWRVIGEAGHVAVVEALQYRDSEQPLELNGVAVRPGSADGARRLALGHWMRRWWPASDRDGIAALDRAVLDAEIALLTAAAEDYFTDDTIDAEVTGLLRPHMTVLNSIAAQVDPRISAIVEECRDLAAEIGLTWDTDTAPVRRRDDYALAAGSAGGSAGRAAIAGGVATVNWSAVPPAIFDAADDTVDWSVVATLGTVNIVVHVALSGPGHAAGIEIRVRCGDYRGTGVLDDAGRAILPVLGSDGQPLTETQAWNVDWLSADVRIGAGAAESASTRDRVRALAMARLATPRDDAYLAEILAAESDY
ncbi:hypothetical protein ACRCUN_20005 [Mycobacterium sp. LTG2003]